MDKEKPIQKTEFKKACINCGAELKYKPGTTSVTCGYCGYNEKISIESTKFQELELYPYLEKMGSQKNSEEISILHCENCGANQHVEENYKSLHCVYCSMPLILEDARKEDWILPGAILPFQIDKDKSFQIFKKWVSELWWAPNKLKKASLDAKFTKGLYLPYWTFDAQMEVDYTGERGDNYTTTEYYTDSDGRRQSREVTRTSWSSASGHLSGFVDDMLVEASKQRAGRVPSKISHWDLDKLQPYHNGFLAGFVTEKYTISLEQGHVTSDGVAHSIADSWSRNDIGGDKQRVHSLKKRLTEETFKHILLPIYVSAYSFNGKDYNFFVNGESGKISGDRPYSFWKIFFAILTSVVVISTIVYFVQDE